MNGRRLYELWRAKMAESGIDVDDWPELDKIDKDAWEAMADDLFARGLR